jgi:hypothetical protein
MRQHEVFLTMLASSATDERTRLIGFMDAYLQALAAHDFRALRFAPNLRNTENGIELPVGSGLSRTIRGISPGGQYFADVRRGQIEYWGAINEMGAETIMGVRLRIEGTLISEIETLGVRNTDPYFFPDVIARQDEEFHAVIPAEERCSRAALVEVANRYFDAIEQRNGAWAPAREDCQRLVNGAEDTMMDVTGLSTSEAHRALSVQHQIDEGHYAYIEALRGRRFPIIDEERGLVLAHVLFDHPGDALKPDGSVPFTAPNTMLAFEVFKVSSGVIQAVWALAYTLTYGAGSGWGAGEARCIVETGE